VDLSFSTPLFIRLIQKEGKIEFMSQHHTPSQGSTAPTHHYVIPDSLIFKTGGSLLVLTALTVGISYINFGQWNFIIGMLVATVKAGLVAGVFMNLAKDHRSNLVIFLMGFLFLAIFIVLTATDILFRPEKFSDNKPLFQKVDGAVVESKFQNPWEPSPGLVLHGKAIYANNCVSCHGAEGAGNGPAAAALNPHPRNFTADAGWKNGRKPSQIFRTLKEGIAGGAMASYVTVLPNAEDRWALSHYVASLGPNVLADTDAEKKAEASAYASDKPPESLGIDKAIKAVIQERGGNGSQNSSSEYLQRLEASTLLSR